LDRDVFRPAPGADLEQGDVLDLCPAGSIGALRVAREWAPPRDQPNKNPTTAFIYTHPVPPLEGREKLNPPLWEKKPLEQMLFDGTLRRCMVLSDSCIVIEKAQNQAKALPNEKPAPVWPVHVAPMRAWPSPSETVAGEELSLSDLLEQDLIHRYLPLPAYRRPDGEQVFGRCYVDLRYATPVKIDLLQPCPKLASLNANGLAYLQRKMFTFFSGIQIPQQVSCPSCETSHPTDTFLVRGVEK